MTREWHPRAVAQISLRSAQFLFASVSAALYAVDVTNWSSYNLHVHPNWIYAEVVSAISVASCFAQWWLALPRAAAATWDAIIFLLWLVTVAVFALILSGKKEPEEGFSIGRVGAAVGIDGLNMTLWLASVVEVCLCCGARQRLELRKKPEVSEEPKTFTSSDVKTPEEQPPPYERV
ncbi:hypothetical protein AK830_g5654 [Neonectria ditissima]|uniref:MARVEL domain-containing protein n=1 Tax=Neonectria ditissima TaxID=78410 RepID=A0A0P7B3C5_9HYPO|nr:hypothetical protein AK830_g5654 [Neonectria ditissima]